jgi:hypothetical protein
MQPPKPIELDKMHVTSAEYFGDEQHHIDFEEIVNNQQDALKIVGKFQGNWSNDLDTAVSLAHKHLYCQRDDHSDYLYITPLTDALPTISQMPAILGFEKPVDAKVQMQRPGCVMHKHLDPDFIFNDPYRVRLLITLAPWEYGQCMFFNNTVFHQWEAGTIIYTNFNSIYHFTVNASWHTRPILQITGVPGKKLQDILNNPQPQIFNI